MTSGTTLLYCRTVVCLYSTMRSLWGTHVIQQQQDVWRIRSIRAHNIKYDGGHEYVRKMPGRCCGRVLVQTILYVEKHQLRMPLRYPSDM